MSDKYLHEASDYLLSSAKWWWSQERRNRYTRKRAEYLASKERDTHPTARRSIATDDLLDPINPASPLNPMSGLFSSGMLNHVPSNFSDVRDTPSGNNNSDNSPAYSAPASDSGGSYSGPTD